MKNSILRMSLVIAVVVLSVAVFSAPASAQFYAGGKGSAFLPNSSDPGLSNFDTGFGLETFAGYRFMPYFGLEAGVGFYQSKGSESDAEVRAEATVSAIPLTFTAKGFMPLGDKARLYAGAGVGMYFAKAEVAASYEYLGVTISSESDESDKSAFGYHAVLGGEFMVSSNVGLQAEAKWFKVEPEFFDDSDKVDIGGVMLSFGVLFQL